MEEALPLCHDRLLRVRRRGPHGSEHGGLQVYVCLDDLTPGTVSGGAVVPMETPPQLTGVAMPARPRYSESQCRADSRDIPGRDAPRLHAFVNVHTSRRSRIGAVVSTHGR